MSIEDQEATAQHSGTEPAHPQNDPRVSFVTTAQSRANEPADVSVYDHSDIRTDGAHRKVKEDLAYDAGTTQSARTTFYAREADDEEKFDRLWKHQLGLSQTWEDDPISKQAVENAAMWRLCDTILRNCEVPRLVRQPALRRVIATDLRGFNRYHGGISGACIGFAALRKHDTAEEAANSLLAERAASVVPTFDIEAVTKLLSYVFRKHGEGQSMDAHEITTQRWNNIPKWMQAHDHWIVTDDKEPHCPSKNWTDMDEQLSFDEAKSIALEKDMEIAFALHSEGTFIAIDLDDVAPFETLPAIIKQLIKSPHTYCEVSRSGNGLHIICFGKRIPGRYARGELNQGGIEVYDDNRYIVLTGAQKGPCENIAQAHETEALGDQLSELQRQHLPEKSQQAEATNQPQAPDPQTSTSGRVSVSANDIRKTLEEYQKDGNESAEKALNRWRSSEESSLRFPSASEADLAFVSDLAFWCREDRRLIDKCFRQSNRMRAKWDEVHYSNGRTYGEATIQKAVRTNRDVFGGNYVILGQQ